MVDRRRRDVHVVAGAVAEQVDTLRRVVGAENTRSSPPRRTAGRRALVLNARWIGDVRGEQLD